MLNPKDITEKKAKGEKISMVTAYDYAFAQMAEAAGIDQILVGDSLANTMLGYKTTRDVGMTEMLIFVGAVCRGAPNTHVVADMPYMSDKDPQTAYDNARRFLDLGAASVKLEGTPQGVLEFLCGHDIPVCAHLGLLPQTAENFKQKGKTEEEARAIEQAARFVDNLGCFEMVLEHIPEELGTRITREVKAVTIGIGGGRYTDGQVLVVADMLGMTQGFSPRFLRRYADLNTVITDAVGHYVADVKSGDFPNEAESY